MTVLWKIWPWIELRNDGSYSLVELELQFNYVIIWNEFITMWKTKMGNIEEVNTKINEMGKNDGLQ